jgi:hypothetical protein
MPPLWMCGYMENNTSADAALPDIADHSAVSAADVKRYGVAIAGSRAPSSIWRARDGFRTPSGRDGGQFPDQDAALCDFTPVRTFRVRVEQLQIGDEMFPVVGGQHGLGGRGIGNIWIKRRRHRRSRDVFHPPIIALAPWHIDDSRLRGLN